MPTHALIDNPIGDNIVATYYHTTEIDHSQIMGIMTNKVQVLPALGENLVAIVDYYTIQLSAASTPYGNIDNATKILLVYGNDWDDDASDIYTNLNYILAGISNGRYKHIRGTWCLDPSNYNRDPSLSANKAIYLHAYDQVSGAFTGGDPSNKLIVTVFYSIIQIQ